jgi:hypothetical protein
MNLLLSVLSGVYIIYMFNYFKTDIYLSHPFDIYINNVSFLNHDERENHICSLGNLVGYFLAFWFIVRHFIPFRALQKNILKKINILIFNTVLFGSFLTNMNAFVYFLTLYIIDNLSLSI